MKAIWKYPLSFSEDYHEVAVPRGAQFIMAAMQHGQPTVWAEVDPSQPRATTTLSIHGTGHKVGDNEHYIDSFSNGPFVWHVFEVHDAKD